MLCVSCEAHFTQPYPSQRILENGFKVNSFYAYDEIAGLLHTKHQVHGAFVFKILARASFGAFTANYMFETPIFAVPVDDHVRHGYSHTAILARALQSETITPLYGAMRARNSMRFSGKSLAYRKANSRGFTCNVPPQSTVILVDDLITSGQTLLEASNLLKKKGVNPIFGLTLANANVS